MADDKKRPSVADILKMARQADSEGAAEPPQSDAPPAEEVAETPAPTEKPLEKPAEKPAAKKPSSGGGRPSVADMLAMARQSDAGADEPAAKAKPAAEKPAAKPTSPKPAAKPAAAKSGVKKPSSSILAGTAEGRKPGPMTRAEAAKQKADSPEKPAAKARPAAPPMPAKPAYAKPQPIPKAGTADASTRRGFFSESADLLFGSFLAIGFTALALTNMLWGLGTARFMFPNILTEPPTKFKVGFPDQFAFGFVETKFKAQFGIWVVRAAYEGENQIFALSTVCTHLGCTPNWLEAEQKFKCPCHGSGFYKDGINFEGPAPRPLERYAVRIADDGQLEIDKSRKFQEEMGQWKDPASFVPV